MSTVPQIEDLSEAPSRADDGDQFTAKADALLTDLQPFAEQANTLASFVNTKAGEAASSAQEAAASVAGAAQSEADAEVFRNETEAARDAALALVNFAGKWADLTGPLNTPATVFHNGAYWNLLNDLADVTASEPANDNADWLFVYSNSELRRKLLDEASLYADFENGDYRLYEGIGSGAVRNKAFSDLFDFTRSSDATGFGVSTLETVTADVARFVYSPEIKRRQGLLIEGQRTNLLLWSEDFTQGAWVKTGVTVSGSTLTSSQSSAQIRQNLSGGADTYVLSGRIKKSVGNSVVLQLLGGSEWRATLNLNNLTFSNIGSSVSKAEAVAHSNGDVFIQLVAEADFVGSNGPGIVFPNAGDELIVRELQVERGSFPTRYIKTEGTQATRAADSCSRVLGEEFNAEEFTLFLKVKYKELDYATRVMIAIGANNNNKVNIFQNGSGIICNQAGGVGTGLISYSKSNLIDDQVLKCAVTCSQLSSVRRFYVNGEMVGEIAGYIAPSISTLRIGYGFVSDIYSAPFRMAHIIPRALSEAELIALTTPEAE